jgi:hypothetical protein
MAPLRPRQWLHTASDTVLEIGRLLLDAPMLSRSLLS